MRQRRHPLSGAIYDVRDDGNLDVSQNGRVGVFTPDGDYVSGDVHHADPHLCLWLAGRTVPAHVMKNPKDLHPSKHTEGAAR
jgi:hypothetical protein